MLDLTSCPLYDYWHKHSQYDSIVNKEDPHEKKSLMSYGAYGNSTEANLVLIIPTQNHYRI